MSQPDTPPGAGLEVEVRVGWLLPPLRVLSDDSQDLVEALAAMHAEQQRIVDYRGPAATAAAVLRVVADQLDPPPALSQALLAAVDAYNTPRGRQVAEPRRWEAVVIPDEVRVVADDYGGRWVRLLRNPALYSRPVYDLWEHDAPHAEREGGPLTTGQLLEGFGPISEVASAP